MIKFRNSGLAHQRWKMTTLDARFHHITYGKLQQTGRQTPWQILSKTLRT